MEQLMDFVKTVQQVHKPNRVNPEMLNTLSGVKITGDWKITCKADSDIVVTTVVEDLQDYFKVSMNLELAVETAEAPAPKTIFLAVDEKLAERTFSIKVTDDSIVINGVDPRYTAQGSYALEDKLNMNEAPIIEPGETTMKMRFSMRDIMSGLNNGLYPDGYLCAMAHAGFTAIDVGLANTEASIANVNGIIANAAKYGLDVYAHPSLRNTMHPDDPGAFEYYDTTYGALIKNCPGLKGFFIVGEICEFPSKDERTTGKSWRESKEEVKTSPGWFPCRDYPQFIALLRDVVRSHKADAEIVFWTYNWGYEKQELREELLRNVPTDITMMATFEMFEEIDITPNVQEITTDYTLWQIGPGKYYTTESKIARERGIRMYSMTNTAGNTWDIGGVPYLPAPQRWIERWQAVVNTEETMQMDGMRESHSYGFWPSFLPEMAKYAFMQPQPDLNELLNKLIIRDFGKEHLDAVLKAYELFSEGISHCVSTNEDQYGPARVGPSYPLFFKYWELIPNCPVTGKQVNYEGFPVYTYNLDRVEKLQYETEEYIKMARLFAAGVTILEGVIAKMEGAKKQDAMHILQVATYLRNNANTIHRVKRWHYLKGQLGLYVDAVPTWVGGRKNMVDAEKAKKPLIPVADKRPIVLELLEIIQAEIENAKNTIPLVEANSRLGFEREYGYSCCKMQLEWKIAMAEKTIAEELLPLLAEC